MNEGINKATGTIMEFSVERLCISIFDLWLQKKRWMDNAMKGVGHALYVMFPLYQSCVILRSLLVGHRLHTPLRNKCSSNQRFLLKPHNFSANNTLHVSICCRHLGWTVSITYSSCRARVWFLPSASGTLQYSIWSRRTAKACRKWYGFQLSLGIVLNRNRKYPLRYENDIRFRGRQRGFNWCS